MIRKWALGHLGKRRQPSWHFMDFMGDAWRNCAALVTFAVFFAVELWVWNYWKILECSNGCFLLGFPRHGWCFRFSAHTFRQSINYYGKTCRVFAHIILTDFPSFSGILGLRNSKTQIYRDFQVWHGYMFPNTLMVVTCGIPHFETNLYHIVWYIYIYSLNIYIFT